MIGDDDGLKINKSNILTLSMFLSYSSLASCSARSSSDSVCKSTPTSFAIWSMCMALDSLSRNVTNYGETCFENRSFNQKPKKNLKKYLHLVSPFNTFKSPVFNSPLPTICYIHYNSSHAFSVVILCQFDIIYSATVENICKANYKNFINNITNISYTIIIKR